LALKTSSLISFRLGLSLNSALIFNLCTFVSTCYTQITLFLVDIHTELDGASCYFNGTFLIDGVTLITDTSVLMGVSDISSLCVHIAVASLSTIGEWSAPCSLPPHSCSVPPNGICHPLV
jgi:hypothetical protein